jgi:hypothetical protein
MPNMDVVVLMATTEGLTAAIMDAKSGKALIAPPVDWGRGLKVALIGEGMAVAVAEGAGAGPLSI